MIDKWQKVKDFVAVELARLSVSDKTKNPNQYWSDFAARCELIAIDVLMKMLDQDEKEDRA